MWSPAQSSDRGFWLQWLNKYKSFRFLWDVDEKAHSNRTQRNVAYEQLAEMAKVVAPEANVLFVRNRIAVFRACFRRERRKVKAAKDNGTTYQPNLFYYDTLKFLDPENDYEPTNGTWDTIYSDDEDPFNSESTTKPPKPPQNPTPILETKKKSYENPLYLEKSDDGEESDNTTESTFQKPKRFKMDEYEILGQRIAAHFRKMDEEQSLLAEKIISEVCIYARLKALTMQTGLNMGFPTPGYQQNYRRIDSPRNENSETVYQMGVILNWKGLHSYVFRKLR